MERALARAGGGYAGVPRLADAVGGRLRLPTGMFYAQGVMANVLFFDRRIASEKAVDYKTMDLRFPHECCFCTTRLLPV